MSRPAFASHSELMRVTPEAAGGMKTARLIINAVGQPIGENENVTLKWDLPLDDTDSWDDIGLEGVGPEYHTTGTIVFPEGFEYEYHAFAQIAPDGAYTTGGIMLRLIWSGVVTEQHSHPVTPDSVPNISVPGARRVLSGNSTMTCVLLSDDLDDTGVITDASIYIKQIKAF